MREIKFRVWTGKEYRFPPPLGEWDTEDFAIFAEYQYGAIFEQYTGLKDKKGREIYEGDVVRYNDDTRVTVEWIDDRGRWSPFSDRDDFPPFPYAEESELIGNIHENPDLLSEAKVK